MERGLFITFEGGEGAGKSSLIQACADLYSEYPIVTTRAPGGTNIGGAIREVIFNKERGEMAPSCELLLFLADRAQHVEEVILPALFEGKIVFCDRYNDSTTAYQGKARGFPMERIADLSTFATGGLQPDHTFYLDVDPEIGLKRVATSRMNIDRIEEEAIEFHQKIREGFLEIAAKRKKQGNFYQIDASASFQEVLASVMEVLNGIFQSAR